ncbi:MAG: phosphatase PAP2 family protein [Solirubrobacteraceae bacterium]
MPKRARIALYGAGAGALALIAVWFATFHIALVRRLDQSILIGFTGLQRPRLNGVAYFVATLCNPDHYVLLVAVPVIVALVRRRPRHVVAMVAIVLGANLTTQLLKPLLAAPRPIGSPGLYIDAASWPSGHATAAMTLVLCAVLAAPARRRPLVAALMGAFAIAVCYSFLSLHWHYPTDVLGGFLVAATWSLAGAAALFWAQARWPVPSGTASAAPREAISVASVLRPVASVVACAAAVVAIVAVARPHAVISYASAHSVFVIGAAAIAACGLAIAGGASLALNRSR